MRYTLLLHWPEVTVEDVGKDEWEGAMAAFHAYTTALEEAGALVSAEVLQPTNASTTLLPDGGTLRVDALVQVAPTLGAQVARAAVIGQAPC